VENRRLLLFFVLSTAILLAWQWLAPAPRRPASRPAPASTAAAATPSAPPATPAASSAAPAATGAPPALPAIAAAGEQQVVLEGPEFRAVFTNRGAQLKSLRLKDHRDDHGQPLELVRARAQGPWPLGVVGADLKPLPLDDALFAVARSRDAEGHDVLRFDYRGPAGSAHKVISLLGPGLLGLDVSVASPGWGLVLGPGLRNPTGNELASKRLPRVAIYRAGGKVSTVFAPKAEKRTDIPAAGLSWIGLADNYFLTVVVPESPLTGASALPVTVELPAGAGQPYRMVPFEDDEKLPATQADLPRDFLLVLKPSGPTLVGKAYLGAKQYERLAKLGWGLEESLQWGMWGFLSRPLLWSLLWLHDHAVPNYGWSIILLTLGLRVLLFPLTWSSQRSMQRMQELQPRMQAIRQKYRGKLRDKNGRMDLEAQRRMNEEMQELFRSEGANPYGGCLPILVQIPVFFALFTMLRSAVELRGAPWIGWIYDLSLGFSDVQGAAKIGYFLLPVAMGASQVYQQRLTPMSGDPMQRRLMQMFPFIFTIFSFGFPAGLVLYWTVNNGVTILQTMGITRLRKKSESADGKRGKGRRREAREAR
jgi:YidC/Oxa1 family membrane protein insertase